MRAALIAAIVTQVAVTSTVLLWRRPSTTVIETHAAPITLSFPVTVQAPSTSPPPPTPPAAVATAPGCPAPRTEAPRAARANPPADVTNVFASTTNAGWIVAWDNRHVVLSIDAGLTFERVMDGAGDVRSATFDCFGNLIVLRGTQLGIREGTRERWFAMPPGIRAEEGSPTALIGGGPDVIVIGTTDGDSWSARMAVSSDRGRSWWYRDLVDYWESSLATGYQASDGTIQVALTTADCMHDPVTWFRIRDGKLERDELGTVGKIIVDRERAYIEIDGKPHVKRFRAHDWRPAGKRGERLLRGSVDAAGRVWTIDETKDGEAAWALVDDR